MILFQQRPLSINYYHLCIISDIAIEHTKSIGFFKLKARTDNSSVFSIDICANNGILKKYDGTLSHSNLGIDFHTYCDSDLDL